MADGRQVNIRGTIDRVDQRASQVRVIDYKTGFVDASKLKVSGMHQLRQPEDRNKSLQLMTYAWLYLQNNTVDSVTAGIISLRNARQWLLPLTYQKEDVLTREHTLTYQAFLTELLEEIYNPDIPISKNPLTLQSDE
ncbi:MAG: PD-(D/E)XK nuclease family protein [Owenweeksia sp.]|nr:PD-(D/E)XK nuclease family protein [Owenweeksia sp.]